MTTKTEGPGEAASSKQPKGRVGYWATAPLPKTEHTGPQRKETLGPAAKGGPPKAESKDGRQQLDLNDIPPWKRPRRNTEGQQMVESLPPKGKRQMSGGEPLANKYSQFIQTRKKQIPEWFFTASMLKIRDMNMFMFAVPTVIYSLYSCTMHHPSHAAS